jgi:hypothetical protein
MDGYIPDFAMDRVTAQAERIVGELHGATLFGIPLDRYFLQKHDAMIVAAYLLGRHDAEKDAKESE